MNIIFSFLKSVEDFLQGVHFHRIHFSLVSRLLKLGLVNFFHVHSLNDGLHFNNVIHSGTNVIAWT
jgi:hypothetical protein